MSNGTANLDLVVTAQIKAKEALDQLKGQIQDTKDSAKGLKEQMQDMGKNLTSVGTKLTAGVTLPIVGIGVAALEAAAKNEQLQVAFTTMLGSADKAKKLLADLADFSASTPFELPEVQQAGKTLLAFGFDADKIKTTLKALGDVAAGTGAPIGQMAEIFGKAKASGRVYLETLNQLTLAGVPILKTLAQNLHTNEDAIRKMASTGKLSFNDLQNAFTTLTSKGGLFDDMMSKQSQTILGEWSTMHDQLTIMLQDLGTQIIDTFDLKTKFASALDYISKLREGFGGFVKNNPELFKMAIILAAVAAAIGPLLVGLGMLMGVLANLTPLFAAFGAILGVILSPIGLVAAALAGIWIFNVGGIRDLTVKVAGLLSTFAQSDAAKTAMNGLKTSLGEVKDAFVGLATGQIGIDQFVKKIKDAVSGIPEIIRTLFNSTAFSTLKTQLSAALGLDNISFDKVSEAFGKFSKQFVDTINNFDYSGSFAGLKNKVETAISSIDWTPASNAFDKFKTTMNTARDSMLDNMATSIKTTNWTTVTTGFLDSLTAGVKAINFKTIGTALGEALSFALDPETMKTAFKTAFAVLNPMAAASIAGIEWVMDSKNFSKLGPAVSDAIEKLDWSTIGQSFGNLVTAIKNGMGDLASGFTAGFKTPAWIQSIIDWKFPTVPEVLSSLVKWAFPNMPKDLTSLLKWVWPGLPEAITALLKWGWPAIPGSIVSLLVWSWPGVPSAITTLLNWSWPGVPSVISKLLDWSWPALKMPGWVSKLFGFSDDGSGHAMGTSYSSGGLKTVGERGTEVMYVPQGTQVLNARDTMRLGDLAGMMGGGDTITINITPDLASMFNTQAFASVIIDEINRRKGR